MNAGDQVGACEELRRWVYAGGIEMARVDERRDMERSMCLATVLMISKTAIALIVLLVIALLTASGSAFYYRAVTPLISNRSVIKLPANSRWLTPRLMTCRCVNAMLLLSMRNIQRS